jgi:hypothetical protein
MEQKLSYIIANWDNIPGWKRTILVLPMRLSVFSYRIKSFFLPSGVDEKVNKT